MNVIILQCSLRQDSKQSNTHIIAEMLAAKFKAAGSQVKFVNLVDLNFEPGTGMLNQADQSDDMTTLMADIIKCDALIIATPIWWDNISSLAQAFIERMNSIDDWSFENKIYPLYGKLFGAVVSGSSDGYQKLYGTLYNWASALGFTIAPHCGIYSFEQKSKDIKSDSDLKQKIKIMVRNMQAWNQKLTGSNKNWGQRVQK
jgi:multimeric flavodoxin WrbA